MEAITLEDLLKLGIIKGNVCITANEEGKDYLPIKTDGDYKIELVKRYGAQLTIYDLYEKGMRVVLKSARVESIEGDQDKHKIRIRLNGADVRYLLETEKGYKGEE